MVDFLLPVDGSESSDRAVQFVVVLYQQLAPVGVRLLYVEARSASVGATGVGQARVEGRMADAGIGALRSAQTLLDRAGIKYTSELRPDRGYMPGVIADYARETNCAAIVMGTRGMGSTGDVLGSIARQVVSQADVPVTLVK
jgi:nucleotide-binding universal stress UspA family protein